MKARWLLGVLAVSSASAQPYNDKEDPATSQHREIRKRYVSTKASAAQLGGFPGQTCTRDSERVAKDRGLKGRCWDPPGGKDFAPLPTLVPGMRKMESADFKSRSPTEAYWFDMPKEAVYGGNGRSSFYLQVPGLDGDIIEYLPYSNQGYPKPALPPLKGRPIAEALAALDKLDLPIFVSVGWSECEGANDTVCQASDNIENNGFVSLTLAMRVRFRGTPDEEREIPKDLEGKPTAAVVAQLKKLGFTNVTVVEKDLPCKRDIVCSAPQPGWQKTSGLIELHVRPARSE